MESSTKERRETRSARRNADRRKRRMRKLLNALCREGFLPPYEDGSVDAYFAGLDIRLAAKNQHNLDSPDPHTLNSTLPYYLRKRAAASPVGDPHEVGRALYHLAQRRGYKSNRKSGDDKDGVVSASILEISDEMAAVGATTMGEFFSYHDAGEERIRNRYTSRAVVESEFEDICRTQSHLISPDLRKELHDIVFFQRKIKGNKGQIGLCELDPSQRRCSWSRPEAQEFRILQSVNNLVLIEDGDERELDSSEREMIIEALEGRTGELNGRHEMSYARARKIMGAPRGSKFSIESDKDKVMKGNSTVSKIVGAVGQSTWNSADMVLRESIYEALVSYEKEWALAKWAKRHLGVTDDRAEAFSHITLEEGYCNLSLDAIYHLLPYLEEGFHYSSAVKEEYPDHFDMTSGANLDFLPPVESVISDRRNPVVMRSLAEFRKIHNALVRKYGKPGSVHIETGDEIKKGKKEKEKEMERQSSGRKLNTAASDYMVKYRSGNGAAWITDKLVVDDRAILKVRLAIECNWICPYTGKSFTIEELMLTGKYDVEHIVPRCKSFDNSLENLTICCCNFNRDKGSRTPGDLYPHDSNEFIAMTERVKRFGGKMVDEKLKRFKMTSREADEMYDDFSRRNLNDTRHTCRLVKSYVGYGFENPFRQVRTVPGVVTAKIRELLGIEKDREDHRHHVVDAIIVGLADFRTTRRVIDIIGLEGLDREHSGLSFRNFSNVVDDIMEARGKVLASHKVTHRVRGPLHEATVYGREHEHMVMKKKGDTYVEDSKLYRHVPTRLDGLDIKHVGDIVDEAVKMAVCDKIFEHRSKGVGPVDKFSEESKDGALPSVMREPVRRVEIYSKGVSSWVNLWDISHAQVDSIVDAEVKYAIKMKIVGKANLSQIFNLKDNATLPVICRKDGTVENYVKKVRVKKTKNTFTVGSGKHARNCMNETNHHMEIVALLDNDGNEAKWKSVPVNMMEAYRRKASGEDIVNVNHGPGTTFKYVLYVGDTFFFREENKMGSGPFVIRSVESSGTVTFSEVHDGRKRDVIKKAGKWGSMRSDSLRRSGFEKVRVSPIGEVTARAVEAQPVISRVNS